MYSIQTTPRKIKPLEITTMQNQTIMAKLEKILPIVKDPATYLGLCVPENSPEEKQIKNNFCFLFPDVYEIGMSGRTLSIIVGTANAQPDWQGEYAFLPKEDMRLKMKEHSIPLYSLETLTPLSEFDMLGFTLPYELCYTNILAILELANIPLRSEDRANGDYPIIIGGGPCVANAEPVADFFDAFVVGEGEEVFGEILKLYSEYKNNFPSKQSLRTEFLKAVCKIEGVYVPEFYDIIYDEKGRIKQVKPLYDFVNLPVKKRVIKDVSELPYIKPIVPIAGAVQNRASVEVLRGCRRGCKFCQAKRIYRPFRPRSVEDILKDSKRVLDETGFDELSLASLSTGDHPQIEKLLMELSDYTNANCVSLSLPSMRIDSFSNEILSRIKNVRKGALTFAPEAGTQRLRDHIGKQISEDDIFRGCKIAFEGGYSDVKLYFMLGLPTETDLDIAAIFYIAERILNLYYDVKRTSENKQLFKKPPSISISLSTFIPKPHTEFEREPQLSKEEIEYRQKLILALVKTNKKIRISFPRWEASFLEATLARGDRRTSDLIEFAFKDGAIMDAWDEHFSFSKWSLALEKWSEKYSLSKEFFIKSIPETAEIPWGVVYY